MLKKLSLANLRANPPKISEISAKCVENLASQNHKFSRIFQHLRNAIKYHGRTSYLGPDLFSDKFRNREFQVPAKIPHHFADIGDILSFDVGRNHRNHKNIANAGDISPKIHNPHIKNQHIGGQKKKVRG